MSEFDFDLKRTSYGAFGKRAFDLFLIVIFSPLALVAIAICGLLVLLFIGRPIIFKQQRASKSGTAFTIYKFRTMAETKPNESEENRINSFGKMLRSSSLDELPQLLNIAKGEMSLVGPRPLPVEYNERYSPNQRARLLVLPGLTGLAQISGRNSLSWNQKFDLDLDYLKRISLKTDLSILFATLGFAISKKGVNNSNISMPEFLGEEVPASD